MAKKNPYQLWLGISSIHPDYYQLLGISPETTDIGRIDQAAREQLSKLKSIDAGEHAEVLASVAKRVKRAHAILAHPEKRSQYDAQLKELSTKGDASNTATSDSNAAHKASIEPVSNKTTQARVSEKRNPESNRKSQSNPRSKMPEETPVPISMPQSDSEFNLALDLESKDAKIPMAVPLNKATNIKTLPKSKGHSAPKISIKTRKLKRNRISFPLTIAIVLFFVCSFAAILYVVLNSDRLFTPQSDSNPIAAKPPQESSPTENDEAALSTVSSDPTLQQSPLAGPPDGTQSDLLEMPVASDTVVPPISDDSPVDNGSVENESESAPMEPDSVSDVAPTPLTFGELSAIRRYIERAHRNLLNRDLQATLAGAMTVKQLLGDSPPSSTEGMHADLWMSAEAVLHVTACVERFWKQVETAAKTLDGDFKYGQSFGTVVEAKPDSIIIRLGGENFSYAYRDIPGRLALAIGEAGSKPDIAEWNQSKAAFYAASRVHDPKYLEQAYDYLENAENSDIQASFLQHFLEFPIHEIGNSQIAITVDQEPELHSRVQEIFSEWGIENAESIGELRRMDCQKLLERGESETLMANENDLVAFVATLAALKQISLQMGNVDRTMEYSSEYWSWMPDSENRIVETLSDFERLIRSPDLDITSKRLWAKQFISFVHQQNDPNHKRKIRTITRVALRHMRDESVADLRELLLRIME